MATFMPGGLDAHDPEVERAMKIIAQLTPAERDDFIRTAYQYIYAYRRTRNPNTLIELVNSAIGTIALRESPQYAQALEDLDAAIAASKGAPTVDVSQLLAAERKRRAG